MSILFYPGDLYENIEIKTHSRSENNVFSKGFNVFTTGIKALKNKAEAVKTRKFTVITRN